MAPAPRCVCVCVRWQALFRHISQGDVPLGAPPVNAAMSGRCALPTSMQGSQPRPAALWSLRPLPVQDERYPGLWEVPLWVLQTSNYPMDAYAMDPGGDVFQLLKINFDAVGWVRCGGASCRLWVTIGELPSPVNCCSFAARLLVPTAAALASRPLRGAGLQRQPRAHPHLHAQTLDGGRLQPGVCAGVHGLCAAERRRLGEWWGTLSPVAGPSADAAAHPGVLDFICAAGKQNADLHASTR